MALDQKDYALLHSLDKDGRASLAALGKNLRLSKAAVAQRISKLERDGIISSYYTIIDSSRLGFLSFRVYLKFANTSPRIEQNILNSLRANSRIWWIGLVQGPWNLGFVIWVKHIYEFRNFWLELMVKFRKYLSRYSISAYSKLRHYPLDYLITGTRVNARTSQVVGEGPLIEIDEVDKQILTAISSAARLPIVQIAQKIGLTPAIVKYRLKKLLQQGVIRGFKAAINTPALGFSLYKVDFSIEDVSKIQEIRNFIEAIPNLVYIDETVGGGDLEAEFHFKSPQELDSVLQLVKEKFHAYIREYDYFVYSKVIKYSYFPTT